MFTVLDLYSGIGGFALATEWAGGKTMAFCEKGPYQQSILRARFPEVTIYDDVTKLCRRLYDCDPIDDESGTAMCPRCQTDFGECACIGTDQFTDTHGFPDVITAGVPCQPASLVGKRRGTGDARWLWPDTLRIVAELEPWYVICENPRALLTLEGGEAFRGILAGFAALGYDVQWDVVPAAALGAGHRRERLWLVASHADCPRLEGHAGHGETGREEEAYRHPAACDLRQVGQQVRGWLSESSFCRNLDGLSERLDAALNPKTRIGNWIHHAKTPFAYTKEALRALQQGAYEEAISVGLGGSDWLQASQILRPDLHGKSHDKGAEDQKRLAAGRTKIQATGVRALRIDERSGGPPQEPELERQFPRESGDALREVPHEGALAIWRHARTEELFLQGLRRACGQTADVPQALHSIQEIWRSASDQDRDWLTVAACNGGFLFHPRPHVTPVANGLPGRLVKDQLTAVGNSLVPQVAYVLMRVIAQRLSAPA